MKFLTVLAVSLSLLASTAQAEYYGGWYVDNNPGGSEILFLGDNSDDTYRQLRGTKGWCGRKGVSYATMRSIIGRERSQIAWWISADCGSVVRVCVENSRGQKGCSSYRDHGWN